MPSPRPPVGTKPRDPALSCVAAGGRHSMDGRDGAANSLSSEGRSPAILVVEDEILVRMVIADRLRDAGFNVIEASNADEAIAVLRSGLKLNAVLTDVQMPGAMNGIGLAQLAKSESPELKCILAS